MATKKNNYWTFVIFGLVVLLTAYISYEVGFYEGKVTYFKELNQYLYELKNK